MSGITEVEIINKQTGESRILFKRHGSYCHFLDTFNFEKYLIQLRLDWLDRDNQYQEPTLDADIYKINKTTGKKKKYKSQKDQWHHTSIEKHEDGSFIYHFTFKDLELLIKRRIIIQNILDGKVRIIGGSGTSD